MLLSCTDHHKRTTRGKTDDGERDEKTRKKNALGAAGLLLGRRGGGEEGGGKGGDALEEKKSATATTGAGEEFCVSITNCFEIEYFSKEDKDEDYVVDAEFLQRMRNNYKQTFQDLKVVGWYFCSVFEEEENEKDEEEKKTFQRRVHEQIGECVKDVIDCPMVLLTVNAKVVVRGDGREKGNEEDEKAEKKRAALPAKLYRYEETDETFKPIAYGIDASSAERVASDHASKATEKTELETKESRVLAYLMERRVGVKALRDRVGTMLEFLEKEVRGENDTEDDRARFEIMRRLNAVCAQKDTQLPNEETANREKSDAALLETLTKLTKACAETESFARRFNCAYKYKKEDVLDASAEADGVGGFAMEHFDHRAPLTTAGGATKPRAFSTTRRSSRRQQHAAAGVGTTSMQID